jgi:hypothetical protein
MDPVEELPPTGTGSGAVAQHEAADLERRRSGELTEAERITARRNRRWMGLVLFPSIIVGVIALITVLAASSSSPKVHPRDLPAGYHSVSDGYFAYAVPNSWSENQAYSDDVGDLDTSGPSGWVAEHVDARATAPLAGETPPKVLQDFGVPKPTPFELGSPQPTTVPGTAVAYRYEMTRPGGFQATVLDTWQNQSGAEVWMVVDADPSITATILASLKA